MGNESERRTNKSSENRFAVHAICLSHALIHSPWTQKKRHSFLKWTWQSLVHRAKCSICSTSKGVREGDRGGGGGHVPSTFKSGEGAHKWVCWCPPPLLLVRAIVIISLIAHNMWLKTQFFKIFLARFARQLFLYSYFPNLANLKIIFHIPCFNCLTI